MKDTKQLTVADLEAAKDRIKANTRDIESLLGTPLEVDMDIAATCIGIVEEMVKLEGSTISDCEWQTSQKQKEIIAKSMNGNLSFGADVPYLTREYVCQLNNLRLKAVAAFGGEVK